MQWLSGAEMLRRINPHVLEDIEDFILLEGFKNQADIKGNFEVAIANKIQKTLLEQREREFYNMDPEDQKDNEKNPILIGEQQDKKRKFKNELRPHQKAWNFEEEVDPTPHVLRPNVRPAAAYIDGRVEQILENLRGMGIHLKNYQEGAWNRLVKETQEIFKVHEQQAKEELAEKKEKAAQ